MKKKTGNFVFDKEINLEELDYLGTKSYSDSLYEIITSKNDNLPLTIGLFGGWGSGKSSILKTLRSRLNNESDFKTVTYDAWKYSKDAFRRSFIFELANEFDLEKGEELKNFYQDTSEDISHKIAINKAPYWRLITFSPLLFLFFLIFQNVDMDLKVFATFLSLFLTIIFYIFKDLFMSYKISISKSKLFSPEQFEEIFKEIINAATKENKLKWFDKIKKNKNNTYKTIVIIIDNIDRCDKNLATELLLTIKNFLEIERCIFIIPVDDEALKRRLEFNDNFESEEFLRKFFNVSIRLKKFTNKDLFQFTNNLIEQYKLGFSPEIAEIVSQEFSKNPRRIIQFLNNLYLEREVALSQENNNFISKGDITNNLSFLAKILIIKEEWPDLYDRLNSNPKILETINTRIIDGKYVIEGKRFSFTNTEGIGDISITFEQFLFFKRTITINTLNYEPFFRVRDFYRDIPDDLIELILKQNWSEIETMIKNNRVSIERVLDIIIEELDNGINKYNLFETRGYNLISLLITIFNDSKYENKFDEVYQKLKKLINDSRMETLIDKLNSPELLNFSRKISNKGDNYFRDFIINILDHQNSVKDSEIHDSELMYQYIYNYQDDIESLQKINEVFTQIIDNDYTQIAHYVDLLSENREALNVILNKSIIDNVINELKSITIQNITDKEGFLKKFNQLDFINEEQRKKILNNLSIIIETNKNDLERLEYFLELINYFYETDIFDDNDRDLLNEIFQRVKVGGSFLFNQFYNQRQRNKQYENANLEYIKFLTNFYFSTEDINHESITILTNYLNRNENHELYLKANESLKEFVIYYDSFNWPFKKAIIARFQNMPNLGHKISIAKTLSEMLSKVEIREGEYVGLQKDEISVVINNYFDLLISSDSKEFNFELNNILHSLIEIEVLKPFIVDKLKKIKDIHHLQNVINIIAKTKDDELLITIVNDLLMSSTDYNSLQENILFIKGNLEEWERYVNIALNNLINNISTSKDISEYRFVTKVYIEQQSIFSDNDLKEFINQKIVNLLANDNKDLQMFGLEQLNNINNLPNELLPFLQKLIDRILPENKEEENLIKEIKDSLNVSAT